MKVWTCVCVLIASVAMGQQKSETGITHSFVISGPRTMEVNEKDEVVWDYGKPSSDASKLANGNYLITKGRRVVEVDQNKAVVWSYETTANPEVMSAQRLADGLTLVSELGGKPRLVEVDKEGKVALAIPIQPGTNNGHMQTRMAQKLPGGTYLVPHRIAPFTREYDKTGKILKTLRVDGEDAGGPAAKNGNFAAHRFDDGSTLITCASGNRMVILDKDGAVTWQLTSAEVGGNLQDVCGLQVLKSGNFLVSCYGNQSPDGLKMMEITRDKKVVWTYQNPKVRFVHTVQVLTTNGEKE